MRGSDNENCRLHVMPRFPTALRFPVLSPAVYHEELLRITATILPKLKPSVTNLEIFLSKQNETRIKLRPALWRNRDTTEC